MNFVEISHPHLNFRQISDFLTWKVTPRRCKMMRNSNYSRPRRNHRLPYYGSSCDETFWNGFG